MAKRDPGFSDSGVNLFCSFTPTYFGGLLLIFPITVVQSRFLPELLCLQGSEGQSQISVHCGSPVMRPPTSRIWNDLFMIYDL